MIQTGSSDVCSHEVLEKRLVLSNVKNITGPLLDALQFAFKANLGVPYILQYLEEPGSYSKILFMNCSLSFKIIFSEIFSSKLSNLTLSPKVCQHQNIEVC